MTMSSRSALRKIPTWVFALVAATFAFACGSATNVERLQVDPIKAAPIERVRDLPTVQTAGETYRVAPIEGSPEQTAIDLGR